MEKYLFADGTGGVREVQSGEELNTLIQAAPRTDKIRIWVFNTHEWISYADFISPDKHPAKKENPAVIVASPANFSAHRKWLKKFLVILSGGVAVFLIYNFTKIEWKEAAPVSIVAGHPANVPAMDPDSLIQAIEITRGQKLDRTTRTNLRIRNTWPERILLQLNAQRDTSQQGSRYHHIQLTIDNTTGYKIDEAVVKLVAWKNNSIHSSDTFDFSDVTYAEAARRDIEKMYRGDSLSVSFVSIKAKNFNFCYSFDKKTNYGSAADRWFCRDQ
jgi:hypothetical protein